jgi:hypothetical protein
MNEYSDLITESHIKLKIYQWIFMLIYKHQCSLCGRS